MSNLLRIPNFNPTTDAHHAENLRAIDRWAQNLAETSQLSSIAATLFGSGADGAVTLTQTSSAPAWASIAGTGSLTKFTMTSDLYATTLWLSKQNGPFELRTNGHRIFATVSMLIDFGIVVDNNGLAGTTTTTGGNGGIGSIFAAGLSGGGGGNGGAGSAGASQTTVPSLATPYRAANTTPGGDGGASAGGPGTGGGAVGGTITSGNSAAEISPMDVLSAVRGAYQNSSGTFRSYIGGGGGGGGSSDGAGHLAGGGGGGGGIVGIYTALLTNNGTIESIGGLGNTATGPGSCGGGGGGGGGAIILVVGSASVLGTLTVTGSAGGAPTGSGRTGQTGDAGLVNQFLI